MTTYLDGTEPRGLKGPKGPNGPRGGCTFIKPEYCMNCENGPRADKMEILFRSEDIARMQAEWEGEEIARRID